MKLVTRPISKDKLRSRCNLMERNRPLSAVPLLRLYTKDDYEVTVNTKRPFSAETLPYNSRNQLKHLDLISNLRDNEDSASVESSDGEKEMLSTQLFKNLISEPIKSYRSYSQTKQKTRNIEDQDTDCSSSEESLGVIHVAPNETNDMLNKYETIALCPLKPGLKTKPPLPKKSEKKFDLNELKLEMQYDDEDKMNEIQKIKQKSLEFDNEFGKTTEGYENAKAFERTELMSEKVFNEYIEKTENYAKGFYIEDVDDSDNYIIEKVPLNNKNYSLSKEKGDNYINVEENARNYDFSKQINNTNPKNTEAKYVNNTSKLECEIAPDIQDKNTPCFQQYDDRKQVISKKAFEKDNSSHLTSKSENELNFHKWTYEDNTAAKDVTQSEIRTDTMIKNIKSQHEEIDRCINRAQKVLYKTKKSDDLNVIESKNNQKGTINKKKTINFDVNGPMSARDLHKKDKVCDNKNGMKKCNVQKIAVKKDYKSNNTSNPKLKFISKPIKSFHDLSEHCSIDEESWMTKDSLNVVGKMNMDTQNDVEKGGIKTDMERAKCIQNDVDLWLNKSFNDECAKSNSFLDILDNVDNLECMTKTVHNEVVSQLPEHDNNGQDPNIIDVNTYDDIEQILKVLDAEDKKSHKNMESIKEIVDELNYNGSGQGILSLSEEAHGKRMDSASSKSSDQEVLSTTSLSSSTSNNYNEILSFLDQVDKNCTKTLACAKERVNTVRQVLEGVIRLDTIPKKEELQSLTKEDLSDQVIDLNLRLKEKSSSIKLLQDELSALREQVMKITRQTETIVKQKMRMQKEEHEGTVKRHQKFIDQLILDKKALSQQCEGLISEMKMLEDRYNSNMKAAEHRHHVELQKVKEMHVAGEKIRRERWIDNKTQKIKELTVKSLEPELQSMASRQQQEISDLRTLHKQELEELELKAARKTQQQCESLREQLTAEREKALVHEREVMRQRYEKLVESEEKGYQEQRRRLLQEHANRVRQCEEREAANAVEKDRAIKQAKDEFEEKLQAVIRRHTNEIKVLKETTELEMEAWRNNYKKQQTIQMVEKEANIREQCKKERDREIELVIERLEEEASDARNQSELALQNRMRRMKEKFDNEIHDVELSEKETKSRYTDTKSRLLECEDLVIHLKATVKQLDTQLKENTEVVEKLTNERNKMKEIVRQEMKNEIVILEKALAQVKDENEKELQQVYARVKIAVARKDEILSELSRDHRALQEKCVYLENMLHQQRKEYLIK